MRGEYGEFNSWQVPMSAATQKSLELMGLTVLRVDDEDEVGPTVDAALYSAYSSDQRIAILLSQKLIGRKNW
jgi:sulfopyruvate decarboxylase TPP-binding subunit|tara:strand:- start:303 stop:518 length:216 start_codon:yes stop_codon:yes gene_type:complete